MVDIKDANAKELIFVLESRGYIVKVTKPDHPLKEKYPRLFKLISDIEFKSPDKNEECMNMLYEKFPSGFNEALEKGLRKVF